MPSCCPQPIHFLVPALLLAGATAWAGPVALAVDVEGSTIPVVEPFTELASGQRFVLAEDARIEFLHYMSCQSVVVQGGQLYFSDENYYPSPDAVLEVERTRCPERIRLAAEGTAAALTLREDGGERLRLGGDAAFVLVGPLAGQAGWIRIRRDRAVIFQGPPDGREFRLPASHEPLADGGKYRVEVHASDDSWAREFLALIDYQRAGGHLAVVQVE